MKRTLLFAVTVISFFLSTEASAKLHRLGFTGAAVHGVDYTTMQAANDSSATGDTVLVFPGSYNGSLNKKLTWIGYGYFLTGTGANTGLQNITGSLSFSSYLYAGASGSVFEGLDGAQIIAYYQETVNTITVKRCNGNVYFNDQTSSNWQISQCYLNSLSYYWSGGNISNLSVSNSYINQAYFQSGGNTLTGQFNNCVIGGGYFGNNVVNGSFVIKNTVMIYQHSYDDNCVYQNSIGTSDAYPIPTGNGNKNITYSDMTTKVFVGYSDQSTYTNDGRWVLKSGSPAKGAGVGGIDAGIFGGTNPYKLSGIPPIPTFYKLSATSTTTSTNPYTITFSVRSNN